MDEKEFTNVQDFIFNAPLYAVYRIGTPATAERARPLFGHFVADGHCVGCNKESTFKPVTKIIQNDDVTSKQLQDKNYFLTIYCSRYGNHVIWIAIKKVEDLILKVGQWPSLADVASDEARTYLPVLGRADAAELHRAIGLASHGIGVGSYVYLRRVFEHLINQTFDAHQAEQGWDRTQFERMRMEDKIDLLRNFLPPFMVGNRKVYGILSKGLHELTEEECLAYFDVLKLAIVTMLEEKKRAADEETRRKEVAKVLAGIAGEQRKTD